MSVPLYDILGPSPEFINLFDQTLQVQNAFYFECGNCYPFIYHYGQDMGHHMG